MPRGPSPRPSPGVPGEGGEATDRGSKSYNPIELDGRWSKKQRSLDGLASTSSKCRVRSGERADDRREREERRRRSVGRQRAQGGAARGGISIPLAHADGRISVRLSAPPRRAPFVRGAGGFRAADVRLAGKIADSVDHHDARARGGFR